MYISQVFDGERIPLSYEIFPPKGDLPLEEAREVLSGLAELDPAYVSITYSAGGSGNEGYTSEIAAMGMNEFGLTTMAHLTAMGASRSFIEERLTQFKKSGIQNILALRGDPSPERGVVDFRYASDLIPLAKEAGFCVGAAAYPEGHVDCLDLEEDIKHLKEKQDAGADFFVTQLFFENRLSYNFLDRCRAARIRIPISFGIMPLMSKAQVSRMVFLCGASLPASLVKLIARWENDEESLRKAGIEYAIDQIRELADHGVDGIHLYSMNRPGIAAQITSAVQDCL